MTILNAIEVDNSLNSVLNGEETMRTGDRIVFSKTPNGSYCSPGVVYLVESVERRTLYFQNELTGSSTFDSRIVVRRTSKWKAI